MRRHSVPVLLLTAALVGCAAPAADDDPSPSPSESYERPDTVDRMHTTMKFNNWWKTLDDDQRAEIDQVFPDFCDTLGEHITYGETSGDTQDVSYNAQQVVLAIEELRLDLRKYDTGREEADSDDLQTLVETGVDVHCDQHAQVIDIVFDDHMPQINEFWDEK